MDEARIDELHNPQSLYEKHKSIQSSNEKQSVPKFGMEMEEFKANLPKDNRVPALKDRRLLEA